MTSSGYDDLTRIQLPFSYLCITDFLCYHLQPDMFARSRRVIRNYLLFAFGETVTKIPVSVEVAVVCQTLPYAYLFYCTVPTYYFRLKSKSTCSCNVLSVGIQSLMRVV